MNDWRQMLVLAVTLTLGAALAIFLIPVFLLLLAVAIIGMPVLRWYLRRKYARRAPEKSETPPGVIDAEYEIH